MKILVVMEHSRGAWHRMSWETLAAAQALSADVEALVAGHETGELAQELARKRLSRVHAMESPLLAEYTADAFTATVAGAVERIRPDLVLFPHTYQSRDFAPKVATRLGRVLVSDVIRLRDDNGLVMTRQLFQGKLNADYRAAGPGPHFASLQAGVGRADAVEAGSAEIVTVRLDHGEPSRAVPHPPFRESSRAIDLTAAELIVSVGRGIKEKDNIGIVEDLARALGAELAASRPICDNGWLPMERQVGSSGQTVAPRVYLAAGISGAIQHLVGMKGSKTVIAINKDPDAPIFEIADYGIIGDLFEVVPALSAEVRKIKG